MYAERAFHPLVCLYFCCIVCCQLLLATGCMYILYTDKFQFNQRAWFEIYTLDSQPIFFCVWFKFYEIQFDKMNTSKNILLFYKGKVWNEKLLLVDRMNFILYSIHHMWFELFQLMDKQLCIEYSHWEQNQLFVPDLLYAWGIPKNWRVR